MITRVENTWYAKYQVDVPEGALGNWRVERFEVSEEAAKWENVRAAIGSGGRRITPGWYTRLKRGEAVVMSDTPAEIADHLGVMRRFERAPVSRVLIHGLGLGMVIKAALASEHVRHVDVVEIDPDVIALVAPHYTDSRLHIHRGDALTYRFPAHTWWSVAWHDIWDTINPDHLGEVTKLKRRYGRRVLWQSAWAEEEMRYHARRW